MLIVMPAVLQRGKKTCKDGHESCDSCLEEVRGTVCPQLHMLTQRVDKICFSLQVIATFSLGRTTSHCVHCVCPMLQGWVSLCKWVYPYVRKM